MDHGPRGWDGSSMTPSIADELASFCRRFVELASSNPSSFLLGSGDSVSTGLVPFSDCQIRPDPDKSD